MEKLRLQNGLFFCYMSRSSLILLSYEGISTCVVNVSFHFRCERPWSKIIMNQIPLCCWKTYFRTYLSSLLLFPHIGAKSDSSKRCGRKHYHSFAVITVLEAQSLFHFSQLLFLVGAGEERACLLHARNIMLHVLLVLKNLK